MQSWRLDFSWTGEFCLDSNQPIPSRILALDGEQLQATLPHGSCTQPAILHLCLPARDQVEEYSLLAFRPSFSDHCQHHACRA